MAPKPPDSLPTGPWTGWYRLPPPLDAREHWMSFTLECQEGEVRGRGSDDVTTFVLEGTFVAGHCDWVKRYDGRHSVDYQGSWDGTVVEGVWSIPGNWQGSFRVWPEPKV